MAELSTLARPYARAAFRSASDAGELSGWSEFLTRAAAVVGDERVAPLIGNPRVQSTELVEFVFELATAGRADSPPPASAPRPAGARRPAGAPAAAPPVTLPAEPPVAPPVEAQRHFLALLAHNQRLPLLPQIASQFEVLRADAEHFANVEVLSARELTSEQSQKLRAALERRLGRTVRLHPRVDSTLIGGAVVHYGDYVVDGSLRRRVERLASAVSGA